MNLKTYRIQIILTILLIGLLAISCKRTQPQGMFKFYSGDPIGDVFSFEPGGDYIKGDTIFYNNNPKGILISRNRRLDGVLFITVKSIETNEKATYINK